MCADEQFSQVVCSSICPLLFLSIHLSTMLCLFVCLSVCLFVHLFLCECLYTAPAKFLFVDNEIIWKKFLCVSALKRMFSNYLK